VIGKVVVLAGLAGVVIEVLQVARGERSTFVVVEVFASAIACDYFEFSRFCELRSA
jgi:hypothetical protein